MLRQCSEPNLREQHNVSAIYHSTFKLIGNDIKHRELNSLLILRVDYLGQSIVFVLVSS